jgi:hypothetical protein
MTAKSTAPTAYSTSVQPILPGGADAYVQKELGRIQAAIKATQALTPSAAVKAPEKPVDGMMRLARFPWRPVSGQTADAWVYYDAVGAAWRYLSTAPTNS